MADEHNRIDSVYTDRKKLENRYSLSNHGNRFNHEQMLQAVNAILLESRIDIPNMNWLDLGSGELTLFEDISALGFDSARSIASDILLWRLLRGRDQKRGHNLVNASARQLPFGDESFDLISQFTMMTSILDSTLKKEISEDILRVLRPGGYLLWYDFRVNNPGNKNTRAIGAEELRELFSPLKANLKTITLLPPLARKIGLVSDRLLKFLNIFPMLRTHYLALIGPKQ